MLHVTEPSRIAVRHRPSSDPAFERFRTRSGGYERIVIGRDGRHIASFMAGYTGSDARPGPAPGGRRRS